MPFLPVVKQQIVIGSGTFTFLPNPKVPRMVYGQTAGKATVYKVQRHDGDEYALKVFQHQYIDPQVVVNTNSLSRYQALPGLRVCKRLAITPDSDPELINEYPELAYSVLMPWVTGTTWFDIIQKSMLTPQQSLTMAAVFANTLAAFEQWRISHCDISNGNVLFHLNPVRVELVDVEDLYAPKLTRPRYPPGGSPGYAHHTAPNGLWSPVADRFAAAIMLAEILGWCDPRILNARHGEQFFNPREMPQGDRRQPTSDNFKLMLGVLYERWGKDVSEALSTAWYSDSLEQCPSLQQWATIIDKIRAPAETAPNTNPSDISVQLGTPTPIATPESTNTVTPVKQWAAPRQLDADDVTSQSTPVGASVPTSTPVIPAPVPQKPSIPGWVWVIVIIVVIVIIMKLV